MLAFPISCTVIPNEQPVPPMSGYLGLPTSLQQVLSCPVYSKNLLADPVWVLQAVKQEDVFQSNFLFKYCKPRWSWCPHGDPALVLLGSLCWHIPLLLYCWAATAWVYGL